MNIKALGFIGFHLLFADTLIYDAAENLNDIYVGVIENPTETAFQLIPLSAIISGKLVKLTCEEMIVYILLPFLLIRLILKIKLLI